MSKQLRATRQRHAIKQAFEREERPLSPREVLYLACSDVPHLGIATVYRNIKTMVEQGELAPVELPGQAPRYAIPSARDAYVFLDQETDRAYFIDPSKVKLSLPTAFNGFRVDRTEVIFYGQHAVEESVI